MEEYREQFDAFVQELGFVPAGDDLWQRKTESSNLILSLVMVGDTPHVEIAHGDADKDITYCRYALQGPAPVYLGALQSAIVSASASQAQENALSATSEYHPLLEKRQAHTNDPRHAKPL